MTNIGLNNLTVLNNILRDKVFGYFAQYADGDLDSFYKFLHALYENGNENDFGGYVGKLILHDDNALARTLANKKTPSEFLKKAYLSDLSIIKNVLASTDTRGAYAAGELPDLSFEVLNKVYAEKGYGIFMDSAVFAYENSRLTAVENYRPVRLCDLKNYVDEKKLISDNLAAFIGGLPYSHMLLYGERGTGKSSTIHAMVEKFYKSGLRLIEVRPQYIPQIPTVLKLVKYNPLKFIIFIDDLSLNENDPDTNNLKTYLEGSVYGLDRNAMLAVTTNRRHIVKENFSERDNAVHRDDILQEELSLADRFGLSVLFSSTDKEEYLSIVNQLASDCNISIPQDKLFALAESWAIEKGGRSPRRAKQFTDYLSSSLRLSQKQ